MHPYKRQFAWLTEERGVEADTKLSNEVAGFTCRGFSELGQEVAGPRLGDGSQIADQVGLRHANTGIRYVEYMVVLVSLEQNGLYLKQVSGRSKRTNIEPTSPVQRNCHWDWDILNTSMSCGGLFANFKSSFVKKFWFRINPAPGRQLKEIAYLPIQNQNVG